MRFCDYLFSDGRVAVAFRGLFIIPLTVGMRVGIILPCMNIHGLRISEKTGETETAETDGRVTNTPAHTHTVKEYIQSNHDDFNHPYDISISVLLLLVFGRLQLDAIVFILKVTQKFKKCKLHLVMF